MSTTPEVYAFTVFERVFKEFGLPKAAAQNFLQQEGNRTITVTHCGRICLGTRKINLSTVFAGQNVGAKEVSDKIWLVTFMHYDLGFFDHQACRLETVDNRSSRKCYLCLRYKPLPM